MFTEFRQQPTWGLGLWQKLWSHTFSNSLGQNFSYTLCEEAWTKRGGGGGEGGGGEGVN